MSTPAQTPLPFPRTMQRPTQYDRPVRPLQDTPLVAGVFMCRYPEFAGIHAIEFLDTPEAMRSQDQMHRDGVSYYPFCPAEKPVTVLEVR